MTSRFLSLTKCAHTIIKKIKKKKERGGKVKKKKKKRSERGWGAVGNHAISIYA